MSNDPRKFSLKARLKSFVFAWWGILRFFRTEHNAQIHLVITIIVIGCSIYFKISRVESIAVIFSIAFVWITEMVNTAIEKTMDFISKEKDYQIRNIKDMAAGAVLIAAITAVIIGCIVFLPKLF